MLYLPFNLPAPQFSHYKISFCQWNGGKFAAGQVLDTIRSLRGNGLKRYINIIR